ncbi:peptidoglycan-binding protein [Maricaulis parjimensis]|uniref:peptidoglycan-binding protein n=1 Tax=Maricaulis parjimensis TaxID=144023 RepID=UPI00193944A5|nr:peptidoglycan-binding protein [Maricaulis parjimensis]
MSSPRFARFQEADNGDHWPGFVDALATLLLVIIFLLAIFVAGQFALSRALTNRDDQLADLNAQLAQLADELNIARDENAQLELTITGLEEERDALQGALTLATSQAAELQAELTAEQELSESSRRALALLNQQMQVLRDQIATLNAALDAAEQRAEEAEAQVVNLGRRLNAALAERAAELAAYRSDFFGRLQAILGNRTGVRVVGDRFVFETDVLFPSGSAALSSEGRESLRPIANAIIQLTEEIPEDLEWVIRIDGHTDPVPIRTTYPSNWHLSAARAISVVNWFEELGVPSDRLVAAGFGEHYPIAEGRTAEANARNRRIELKLTSR